jgi:RHS repeat-associated protein
MEEGMRSGRLVLVIYFFIALTFLNAQTTPTWTHFSALGSGPRSGEGAQGTAYDAATDRLIVFGGLDPFSPCCVHSNDTWVLINATGLGGIPTWQQLIPAAPNGLPSPRHAHSVVYDPATNRMIIFGGGQFDGFAFGTLFNDAWVLTNANGLGGTPQWLPLTPTGGPPAPREGQGAFYRQATNEMFVFGGGNNGIMSVPNDLWVLRNANGLGGPPVWVQLPQAGAVPGRLEHFALTFDTAANRMTIAGGCCGYTNATHLLDFNDPSAVPAWTNLFPSGALPTSGDAQQYGYDPVSNSLIVHGISPGGGTNATWLLTDANAIGNTLSWSNIVPRNAPGSPPEGIAFTGSAYNPQSNKFILTLLHIDLLGNPVPDIWVLTLPDLRPLPASTLGAPSPNINPQAVVAEPVSTGNGNYFYQHSDFAIPGRGLPLVFTRTYNARDNSIGPLGANWTHSYNVALSQAADGSITIRWGDGHGETFTRIGDFYKAQPGVFSTLTENQDGTFVLAKKNQIKYSFLSTGRLASIRDRNQNLVTLTYDPVGNLMAVTDAVGRSLALTYDANNRISGITDPIGRTVSFTYSAENDLLSATDPAGGVMSFTYDANHHVISATQPNGASLFTNTYDAVGRVISQTNGRGFTTTFVYDSPSPGSTTITDARGNKTVHTYDSLLRVVKITDATGGITSFAYDSENNRTSVINQNDNATGFAYDTQGNLTAITDPLTNGVGFSYDTQNNLLTATNAKGRTTSFAYDSRGNLTSIRDALGNVMAFAYDGFGQLASKRDARGNATSFGYDSMGNLTKITNALGSVTALSYDGVGRLTALTDPNGHTASAAHDTLNRLVKVSDPLGNQTQFAYDPVGNLLKITDAKGNATSYAYDATNNLTGVTDALQHVTQYAYDGNNNRIKFTNAKNNSTSYAFDAMNRLSSAADPLGFVTSYQYDLVGNVTQATDAKEQVNKFSYDALNRLIGIAYADGKAVAYAYDANGNRTSMADAHGTTVYGYDALDRLISVTHPGGKVVGYSYDGVGNRTQLTYPDGKAASYSYDAANRLSKVTDWLNRNTSYSYDPTGNLIRTAYPNGAGITFAYDVANRLSKIVNAAALDAQMVALNYTLDSVGNRTGLNINGVPITFGYDALNELISAQLGQLKTIWTYDAMGNRLKEVSATGTINYTYDADDRLLHAGTRLFTYDANGNETSATMSLTGASVVYQYDAANRLIAASGYKPSAFAYDGDGNRVSQSVGSGIYSYINDVATSLPVVLQESGPDGPITYEYGLGLIEAFSPEFNFFYHYDGLGSVIALTTAMGKPAAAYAYDPWGNALLDIPDNVGTKNKFRFTGEALDPGTKLHFLRARYYDASHGRLITRDPLPGFSSFPQTANSYAYALNNPTRFGDPSGLLTFAIGVSITASTIGGVNFAVMLVYDDRGNRGLTVSYGSAFGVGLAARGTVVMTNKDTIFDLPGQSVSFGAGIPLPPPLSLEGRLLFSGTTAPRIAGVAYGIGVGGGVPDLPIGLSITSTELHAVNSPWLSLIAPSEPPVPWSWVQAVIDRATQSIPMATCKVP